MSGMQPIAGLLTLCLVLPTSTVSAACESGNEGAVPATTPMADFITDNGDGTVIHAKTGLIWMRCSLGQSWDDNSCYGTATKHPWQQALQAAADLNAGAGYAGATDWRLPNRNELESIVERRCWSPAVNYEVFLITSPDSYWSSSPSANNFGYAWSVNFYDGSVDALPKDSTGYVRLVRGGQ